MLTHQTDGYQLTGELSLLLLNTVIMKYSQTEQPFAAAGFEKNKKVQRAEEHRRKRDGLFTDSHICVEWHQSSPATWDEEGGQKEAVRRGKLLGFLV